MLFNSIQFAIFFVVITVIYFSIPHRFRWFLLLTGSCYFYMAFVPVYILILALTIVIDYFAGILIEREQGHKRKLFLLLSLIANIGILAYFKYFNFLNQSLSSLLNTFGQNNSIKDLTILLPIGLSFHTFQAMSYTIEVYRGNQKAEKHFGIYSLYVMFFPQMVAGPIERPQNLIHQFYEKHYFSYERVTNGLKLIMWGLFKKVVIADKLAIVTDQVFNDPYSHTGLAFIIATLFFTFQIYCDFSGYSDIAIGAASVLGFDLMKNFHNPYLSLSIKEFWGRWHISLSTWFKDYLYIPLGGNRVAIPRWYLNIMIVFMISGLWHGANWTFVIWGLIHGIFMIFSDLIPDKFTNAIPSFVRGLITFSIVAIAWIFFRANNLDQAIYICSNLLSGISNSISELTFSIKAGLNATDISEDILGIVYAKAKWIASFGFIFLLMTANYLQEKYLISERIKASPLLIRWCAYYALIAVIIVFGEFENRQFIYFQF